jgi:hypothetical protein
MLYNHPYWKKVLLKILILGLLFFLFLGLNQLPDFNLWAFLQVLTPFIVPIVFALFLFLFPFVCLISSATKSMLSSLFVMSNNRQFSFSIVSIFWAADTILTVIYSLLFSIKGKYSYEEFIIKDTLTAKIIYILAIIILVLPAIYSITKETLKDDRKKQNIILFLLPTISLGLVFLKSLYNNLINVTSEIIINTFLFKKIFLLDYSFLKLENFDDYQKYLVNWLASFILFLIVYIVVFIVYWPNQKRDKKYFTLNSTPALMYILLVVIMSTHLFSYIQYVSFRFSIPSNVPIVLVFPLGIYLICHWIFEINYFFSIEKINEKSHFYISDEKTVKSDFETGIFRTILEKRANKLESYIKSKNGECTPEQKQTLVVVCASGGGIQAAGWTVKVLTGLQELLGSSFTLATGLISSVSGGSVGTMYYLDQFEENKEEYKKDNTKSWYFPKKEYFKDIFQRATSDSLGAVGWGLAYPDLFRFLGLPLFNLIFPKINRGWVMESYWKQQLNKQNTSLLTWKEQIIEGNLPIPVFNSTTVEDGYRLLISPMNFIGESKKKCEKKVEQNSKQQDEHELIKYARDFNILYKGFDLHIATAARLSATFPYVSPTCRAYIDKPHINKSQTYHIADGGYFDNSGVLTAVEWLDQLLEEDNGEVKRVLIIMINPFPVPDSDSNCSQDDNKSVLKSVLINSFSGIMNAAISPVMTLFKVRNSTLNARNYKELDLLKDAYDGKVDIRIVPINYSSENDENTESEEQKDKKNENTPLSWKLTNKQKDNIDQAWEFYLQSEAWDNHSKPNSYNKEGLKQIWKRWGMPTN